MCRQYVIFDSMFSYLFSPSLNKIKPPSVIMNLERKSLLLGSKVKPLKVSVAVLISQARWEAIVPLPKIKNRHIVVVGPS